MEQSRGKQAYVRDMSLIRLTQEESAQSSLRHGVIKEIKAKAKKKRERERTSERLARRDRRVASASIIFSIRPFLFWFPVSPFHFPSPSLTLF